MTLLEIMIVIAIIGIVAAMSVSTLSGVGGRNAKQNAVNDIYSQLQNARARAANNADVYAIFLPLMQKSASAPANGAIFVYEDGNGDFRTDTGNCDGTGTCGWAGFVPPNNIKPGTYSSTNPDKLLATIYLSDYPKSNVQFLTGATNTWTAPFSPIAATADSSGCSFCTGAGATTKGAILFSDSQVVFLDSSGKSTGAFMGGFVLAAKDQPSNKTQVGVIRATGLISLLK